MLCSFIQWIYICLSLYSEYHSSNQLSCTINILPILAMSQFEKYSGTIDLKKLNYLPVLFGDHYRTFWWFLYCFLVAFMEPFLVSSTPVKKFISVKRAVLAAWRWWDVNVHQSSCTTFFIPDKNPEDGMCIFAFVYSSVFSSCLLVLLCLKL